MGWWGVGRQGDHACDDEDEEHDRRETDGLPRTHPDQRRKTAASWATVCPSPSSSRRYLRPAVAPPADAAGTVAPLQYGFSGSRTIRPPVLVDVAIVLPA